MVKHRTMEEKVEVLNSSASHDDITELKSKFDRI